MKKVTFIKKVSLLAIMLLAGVTSAFAAEVTWTASEQGYSNAQAVTDFTIDANLTSSFGKGASNDCAYYNTGTAVRVYNAGSINIAPNSGFAISKIVITTASSNAIKDTNYTATANCGEVSIADGVATLTYATPTSEKMTISYNASSGHWRVLSIAVTYQAINTNQVLTPVFTPSSCDFVGTQEVALSCSTDGATISYSTDGETWNEYTEPFEVTETTTVKAKAAKAGMDESYMASATYTMYVPLADMDEIFAKATELGTQGGNCFVTLNEYVVSGVKKNNAYVTDGTKGFLIYKSSHGFSVGDVLSGTVQAKLCLYNGAAEFTTLTSSTEGLTVTKGGEVKAKEVSIDDLSGVNSGALVTIKDVKYDGSVFFDADGNELIPYTGIMTALPTYAVNATYEVTGIYSQFKNDKDIYPRSEDDCVITSPGVVVEVGETGYATYSSDNLCEVPDAESGIQLFGAKLMDNYVKLLPTTPGSLVSLNFGVIVKATPNTSVFIEDAKGSEYVKITGNELFATVYKPYDVSQGKAYILADVDGEAKFVACEAGTIPVNKACLLAPAGSYIKSQLDIVEGEATGINSIQTSTLSAEGATFNLAGQKVGADYKGIVIMNGKKYMNK